MRKSVMSAVLLTALLGTVAGCGSGSGTSSGLTTGSLFGSNEKAADVTPAALPAPKPVTASERTVQVAATTARAQRCGFHFDAEQLRANFMAAEEQAGTPPDQMQKVAKEFDATRSTVTGTIGRDEDYCTEGRAREIKTSLSRHLAGDYNPAQNRRMAGGGGFLDTLNQRSGREVFVPGEVFNPNRKGVTRRVEE
jgi:hypothetical protein